MSLPHNKFKDLYSSNIIEAQDKQIAIRFRSNKDEYQFYLKLNKSKSKLEFYREIHDISKNKTFFELHLDSSFRIYDNMFLS